MNPRLAKCWWKLKLVMGREQFIMPSSLRCSKVFIISCFLNYVHIFRHSHYNRLFQVWTNKSNQLALGAGKGRGEGKGFFASMFLCIAPGCLVCCNKPRLQAFLKESINQSLILKKEGSSQAKHCLVRNYPLDTRV